MRHDFFTITKKEFRRFFGDKRLLFSTILLPGLLIFIVYSLMGNVMQDAFAPDEDHVNVVYGIDVPQSMDQLLSQMNITYRVVDEKEVKAVKEKITNQDADLLLVFPEEFDKAVEAYDSTINAEEAAPQIDIYYNSSTEESQLLYQTVVAGLDQYESFLANKFDVNSGGDAYDLATKEDTTAKMFSVIVPMLLTMMLMSGCMALTPDAIAGEKERGTMATLLVTPARRSEIAIGKIASLSVIAMLSGLSSFLGVALSLPKLLGGASDELSATVYSMKDYMMLLLVVLSTVLLLVSVFSIISTYAKTIKEASTLSSPVMILGTIVAVMSSVGDPSEGVPQYFIPLFNSVQCFSGILGLKYSNGQIAVTVVSNLVIAGICVFAMAKMFDSEKIMFSR